MSIFFISGIDTSAGKSCATAMLGRYIRKTMGRSAVTQKLVQTGNTGYSEDLNLHRKIMGLPEASVEELPLLCPEIFAFPASPHLAAKKEKREIDTLKLSQAARTLDKQYEFVLIEGAGGLCVPLTEEVLTVDYVASRRYPVILVSSGKLGSINHTILSLEALKSRGIHCCGIIYNHIPGADPEIEADTRGLLLNYLEKYGFPSVLVELPHIADWNDLPEIDFSPLFENTED